MTSRYQPVTNRQVVVVDGREIEVWSEDFSATHAARQADAEAALEAIGHADSRVVLGVYCQGRQLARVFRTLADDELDLIVEVAPPRRQMTGDLKRVNAEQGRTGDERITYAGTVVVDPLRAPDDRDLEAVCKCGAQVHRLDRRALLEQVAMGAHEVDARSVSLS